MANTHASTPNPEDLGHTHHELSLDTFGAVDDIDLGPCTVKQIYLAVASGSDYVLLFDNVDPVPGTTAPDFQFPTGASQSVTFMEGGEFVNGLSVCPANVGGTASSGSPGAANTAHFDVEPD